MTEYPGRGDPERSMALLWGTHPAPTRGPKPGLDVERIVQAAIDVADEGGLAALSMRRVADRLGVGTMSLYTYVPSKAELLDLMLDRVQRQPETRAPADGWRARLEAIAREQWALFHRHPWMLQVSSARAVLGPNETDGYEIALRAVSGIGLSGAEMVLVVSLIAGYVRGAAQGAVEAAAARQGTGQSDDEWWADREPLLDRYFDADRFPTVAAVSLDGGFDQASGGTDYNLQHALDTFEFGLQRVLDGIAVFVTRPGL